MSIEIFPQASGYGRVAGHEVNSNQLTEEGIKWIELRIYPVKPS